MLRLMCPNDFARCESSCYLVAAQRSLNAYIERNFELNLLIMHSNHSVSLHLYPPHTTQNEPLSDEYSDFPPIRERKSTPDPPAAFVISRFHHRSSAVQHSEQCSSSGVQSPPPPNKGLGQKNILNTIRVKTKVRQFFQQTLY
jgi:hypothetical protein